MKTSAVPIRSRSRATPSGAVRSSETDCFPRSQAARAGLSRSGGGPDRESPARAAWERGKQSVSLDLTAPEGVARLLDLIGTADVFIESFRPGVASARGFGYDVVRRDHPS